MFKTQSITNFGRIKAHSETVQLLYLSRSDFPQINLHDVITAPAHADTYIFRVSIIRIIRSIK